MPESASVEQGVVRWLQIKPPQMGAVLAVRAVLRAIPALDTLEVDLLPIVLQTFRASAIGWVASRYPTHIRALSRSAIRAVNSVLAAADAADRAQAFATATVARAAGHAAVAAVDSALTQGLSVAEAAQAVKGATDVAIAFVFDAESLDPDHPPAIRISNTMAAVLADIQALDARISPSELAASPLWPNGFPVWASRAWDRLANALLSRREGWDVWTLWYESRLHGQSSAKSESWETAFVDLPEPLPWDDGQETVNTKIAERLSRSAPETQRDRTAPAIPPQRPAAIEPVWNRGVLTLSKKTTKTDLDRRKFAAALKALRAELKDFADNIADEANIDRRFVSFVRYLADRIPPKSPPQDELFRLGHAEVVFAGYAKTVSEQWPEFLASRYNALALLFDRTMRQSPLWREFKRNAEQQSLSGDQIAAVTLLVTETAHALCDDDAVQFVDPAVRESLEHLAEPLQSSDAIAGGQAPLDAIEAGKELLALDLIESINNILKRIAEAALVAMVSAGAALRGVGSTLSAAGKVYVEGFDSGLIRAAKKQGPKDGEKLFKWFRRFVIASVPTYAGLPYLIEKYPEAFAWLKGVVKLFF